MIDTTRLTYTVDEVARLLNLSRGVTYQYVRDGMIPAERIGRRWLVPREAVPRLAGWPDRRWRDGPASARPRPASWRASFRDPSGRQVSKTFRTKREAATFLAQSQHAAQRGRLRLAARRAGAVRRPRPAVDGDVEHRGHDDRPGRLDHAHARPGAVGVRGRSPRSTTSSVQAWITDLGDRLAPATVVQCRRLMSGPSCAPRSATG